MQQIPKVSIVITTKNRPQQLVRCFRSVARQKYKNFELIVVDSSDSPPKPYPKATATRKLKYIYDPLYSIPEARQAGIDNSNSPYVMFLDDDCIAPRNWVSSMVLVAQDHPKVAIISGTLAHRPKNNIFALIIADIRDRRYKLAGESSWMYFNIENCLFRRSFFIKNKIRFDPALLHEDFADIALQVTRKGGQILLTKRVNIQHFERQSLEGFLRQRIKNSGNEARLKTKWGGQRFHFFSTNVGSFLKPFLSRLVCWMATGKFREAIEYIAIISVSTLAYKLGSLYYGLLYSKRINRIYTDVKPLMDFSLAVVTLVLAFPIMVIIALIIRFDSNGPILFTQVRLGKDRKKFVFYKFRTMYFDAKLRFPHLYRYALSPDEVSNFRFKTIDDPRLTKFGGYLRKTSLDELPNLINVLRGEMSLIGPRPEIPEMINNYSKEELIKFSVKPGITGMAQVKGRGLLKFKETIKYDCSYARHPAFLMDVEIAIRTIYVVIRGLGAF